MKDLDFSRAKGRQKPKVEAPKTDEIPGIHAPVDAAKIPLQRKTPLDHKKKKIQKTMFSLYLEDKVKLEKMVNELSEELQWDGIKADNSKLVRILIDRAFVNFADLKDEMIEQMRTMVKEITELSTQRNTASRARKMDGLV